MCRKTYVVSGGVDGTSSCFHCVWVLGGSEILPSAADNSDVCRPENFDPRIVHREICPHDCLIMILYDYVGTSDLNPYFTLS
jgi:hypothetical protein